MNPYQELEIFIPTYRRVGPVRTLQTLSDEAKKHTFLMVRAEEFDAYAATNPDVKIAILPKETSNLSQTRQFILQFCDKRYCMMLDDDLEFKYRVDLKSWKLSKFPDNNRFDDMVTEMLERMKAEHIVHCGVSPVEGHSHYLAPWNYLQRYMRAYIFDLSVVGKFTYDESCCGCEDFDMALQLVEAGYPSVLTYGFAQTHKSSNAKGGLSDYRDIAYHNNAMENLRARHPKYVRLVPKKTKTSWGGLPRVDCKVAWRQAFLDAAPKYFINKGDDSKTPRLRPEFVQL